MNIQCNELDKSRTRYVSVSCSIAISTGSLDLKARFGECLSSQLHLDSLMMQVREHDSYLELSTCFSSCSASLSAAHPHTSGIILRNSQSSFTQRHTRLRSGNLQGNKQGNKALISDPPTLGACPGQEPNLTSHLCRRSCLLETPLSLIPAALLQKPQTTLRPVKRESLSNNSL